jgi:uncharacterized membrane protein
LANGVIFKTAFGLQKNRQMSINKNNILGILAVGIIIVAVGMYVGNYLLERREEKLLASTNSTEG